MSPQSRAGWFRWWHELVIFILLMLVLLAASACVPGFLQLRGQLLLSRQMWEMAFLSLGMTLIVISGGIDLSVGAMMGISAVVLGHVVAATSSVLAGSLCCLMTGAVCGALNGLMVARFQIHPLIVTLATSAAFRGISEGFSQGQAYSRFGDGFSQLARGSVLGIPLPGYLFCLLAAGFAVYLGMTPGGRYLYVTGHNEKAARFSGIAVDRQRFRLYLTSGILSGLAALIYVSRFDSAKADVGKGMELEVITAVVIGGTSIFGGRGTIIGTVLGVLLIHEARTFTARYWRTDELISIITGCLLIGSILVYQLLMNRKRS